MGALYREEVHCRHKRQIKTVIRIILAILAVTLVCFLFDLIALGDYLQVVIILAVVITMPIVLNLKKKAKKIYRYEIIDNEIIIEDITNGKRKVIIFFNAKNIIIIGDKNTKLREKRKIEKEYNFLCNLRCKNTRKCIFEKEGKVYSFRFEPSENLMRKIEALRPMNRLV